MLERPLLRGNLVRLAALNPDESESIANWSVNSEYLRLLNSEPARPHSPGYLRAGMERTAEVHPDSFNFGVRTLDHDELIGFVELDDIQWPHGNGWIGIGIGDPEYWSRGYGTDATQTLLRFAFLEAGLHRVSLDVFEYNERAFRSYQKLGFQVEGRVREFMRREGRRWDLIYMGLLRSEWEDR
ncbi:MAG TPA: GNAT family protein [Anaerolineaceae bacterium]|nr:GNAT family protein [Anaerolineaceae bacterium]